MPRRKQINQDAVDALLARGNRVATHAELVALGVAASTITYRIRQGGPWTRLLPGVVVAQSGRPTTRQRLLGAVKYAGSDAVVTGVAALRRHGFSNIPSSMDVHTLVPHGRRRCSRDYVVVERTTRMPEALTVGGVAYAPVARAVIDACKRLKDLDMVRAIVAEAVQSERCHPRELFEELQASSRPGSGLPRQVVREITAGIRSVAEAKAREHMRRAGIPDPEWNVQVEDDQGRLVAEPDGYWEDLAVALEIDSLTWHLGPKSYKRTQRRQRRMTAEGILVPDRTG